MKRRYLMFSWMLLMVVGPLVTKAQLTAKNFLEYDTIPAVYLGIDFTQARLINDPTSNPDTIQGKQFAGINALIVKEEKKYYVQAAYRRKYWTVDLTEVNKRNQLVNPAFLKSSNDSDLTRLKKPDIETLVNGFDYGNKKGYGVLLIVEGMDKTAKRMSIWFMLIDMGAKKALITTNVQSKLGSGFGFRNYWASAIRNAIEDVDKEVYDRWQSKAGLR